MSRYIAFYLDLKYLFSRFVMSPKRTRAMLRSNPNRDRRTGIHASSGRGLCLEPTPTPKTNGSNLSGVYHLVGFFGVTVGGVFFLV